VTQADFDSPISGTPVPYPSDVGAVAQRVFVGDQDGTIWRLDVSNPDPNQWFVEPFFDAYNATLQTVTGITNDDLWAVQRAPIVLAPTVSIGRDGNVVLNFGTGDTNAIGTASNLNFVYSVGEEPNTTAGRLLASVNWYDQLPTAGEMVTGPSAVFDGGYYFATYAPAGSGTSGCTSGTAYLWGMDYTVAAGSTGAQPPTPPTPPSFGGMYKMLNPSNQLEQKLAEGGAIIPGVSITATSVCSTTTATTDPATGGPMLSVSNVSPATYQISALEGKSGASQGNNTAVAQVSVATSVHTTTLVDSWASIVE
jgi:type IV pilus assembly protein PilY1